MVDVVFLFDRPATEGALPALRFADALHSSPGQPADLSPISTVFELSHPIGISLSPFSRGGRSRPVLFGSLRSGLWTPFPARALFAAQIMHFAGQALRPHLSRRFDLALFAEKRVPRHEIAALRAYSSEALLDLVNSRPEDRAAGFAFPATRLFDALQTNSTARRPTSTMKRDLGRRKPHWPLAFRALHRHPIWVPAFKSLDEPIPHSRNIHALYAISKALWAETLYIRSKKQ